MGVAALWALLEECRDASARCIVLRQLHGVQGQNVEISEEAHGLCVACDLSVWIFQATRQGNLQQVFTEEAALLKVVFERCLNLLRNGVTPVFVLEGRTPDIKYGTLYRRSVTNNGAGYVGGNRVGGHHDRLGKLARNMIQALGLTCVQAPGEAEAMCAALNIEGMVDGVMTTDGDALLFGAETVYKELKLLADTPASNEVCKVQLQDVAAALGLARGGQQSLIGMALLSGGDYGGGANRVGIKGARDAVCHLLRGCQDDSRLLTELTVSLAQGPDAAVEALTKCTGCKECKHEKHGKQGCGACGTLGARSCTHRDVECGCAFHTSTSARKHAGVVRKALSTPSFVGDFKAAMQGYWEQAQLALTEARRLKREGADFSWSKRPQHEEVYGLVRGRFQPEWDVAQVRDKLRPCLMEWDMRQGPNIAGTAAASVVEFKPVRIKKVAGSEASEAWRFLVEFERLPGVTPHLVQADVAELKPAAKRQVRMALIRELWPHLETEFEAAERARLEPKQAKGRGGSKKAAAAGAAAAMADAAYEAGAEYGMVASYSGPGSASKGGYGGVGGSGIGAAGAGPPGTVTRPPLSSMQPPGGRARPDPAPAPASGASLRQSLPQPSLAAPARPPGSNITSLFRQEKAGTRPVGKAGWGGGNADEGSDDEDNDEQGGYGLAAAGPSSFAQRVAARTNAAAAAAGTSAGGSLTGRQVPYQGQQQHQHQQQHGLGLGPDSPITLLSSDDEEEGGGREADKGGAAAAVLERSAAAGGAAGGARPRAPVPRLTFRSAFGDEDDHAVGLAGAYNSGVEGDHLTQRWQPADAPGPSGQHHPHNHHHPASRSLGSQLAAAAAAAVVGTPKAAGPSGPRRPRLPAAVAAAPSAAAAAAAAALAGSISPCVLDLTDSPCCAGNAAPSSLHAPPGPHAPSPAAQEEAEPPVVPLAQRLQGRVIRRTAQSKPLQAALAAAEAQAAPSPAQAAARQASPSSSGAADDSDVAVAMMAVVRDLAGGASQDDGGGARIAGAVPPRSPLKSARRPDEPVRPSGAHVGGAAGGGGADRGSPPKRQQTAAPPAAKEIKVHDLTGDD